MAQVGAARIGGPGAGGHRRGHRRLEVAREGCAGDAARGGSRRIVADGARGAHSAHRAAYGIASPTRTKTPPRASQPGMPQAMQNSPRTEGAKELARPVPVALSPEYWPWAWAGASPKFSSNEAAVCQSSPMVCTTTPTRIRTVASTGGAPAANATAAIPSRNATPARAALRPADALSTTVRPARTWKTTTISVLTTAHAPTSHWGAALCPAIHRGSANTRTCPWSDRTESSAVTTTYGRSFSTSQRLAGAWTVAPAPSRDGDGDGDGDGCGDDGGCGARCGSRLTMAAQSRKLRALASTRAM